MIEARHAVSGRFQDRPATLSGAMEQVVDAATAGHPSLLASLALVLAWLLGVLLALVALALLFRR